MSRSPILGAAMGILGVISLSSECVLVWFFGKPLLHWASLLNVLIAASLVTAGALLFRGHCLARITAILAWSAIVTVATLESGLVILRNAQGASVYWAHVASNFVYVVLGGFILRLLVRKNRADVSSPKVVMRVLLGLFVIVVAVLGTMFILSYKLQRLQPSEQLTLFATSQHHPAPTAQILSSQGGDLILTGTVRKDGKPQANAAFVFLFQDNYRSDRILTDSAGRYAYRLPPGEWRFLGPLVIGSESEEVSVLFEPSAPSIPTFAVGISEVSRTQGADIILGESKAE